MSKKVTPDLFSSSHWVLIMGILGAIVTSQWHQEALPLIALIVVLVLTVLKSRLIILGLHAPPRRPPSIGRRSLGLADDVHVCRRHKGCRWHLGDAGRRSQMEISLSKHKDRKGCLLHDVRSQNRSTLLGVGMDRSSRNTECLNI
ncbi:hypothetical protein LP421_08320 [Rhizobium sp. RCAM05350]|nr:hypothetical protein LP421_08320 [Rhizobium sp. RCAM05350]